LAGREFDDPRQWWPDLPDVIGGRDRVAGGTWCATKIGTGATALVLNRPQKRVADAGAPSRGVLPLLAVRHETDWVTHLEIAGMASFALVLATPTRLLSWAYDGADLSTIEHDRGTHMFTSGGPEDRKVDRYLNGFEHGRFPDGWRALVTTAPPVDDPGALVVRHERGDLVFATVFGQLIEAGPHRLRLEYSRTPWVDRSWRRLDIDERESA
jgi:hypothetical protein